MLRGSVLPSPILCTHRAEIDFNQHMKILVTGSSGLIGSEVCLYFSKQGHSIHGIDNNQRVVFFGPQGDTSWRLKELRDAIPSFNHHDLDIRDRYKLLDLVKTIQPDAIVHAAAQPSHDKAASIPFDDFDVNAVGTLNLLESTRQSCPETPFVHMSTNKVYGDGPNEIKLTELKKRWEYADPLFSNGIPETFSIDQCKHSLFGASKVAAEIEVEECAAPKGSYSLSDLFVKPLSPSFCRSVRMRLRLPVKILCG